MKSLEGDSTELLAWLGETAHGLGFDRLGIADTQLRSDSEHFQAWLASGHHGELAYMARNVDRRCQPEALVPGTLRVISVAVDYWPEAAREPWSVLEQPSLGYVARYALGRDYHKTLRPRLQKLAAALALRVGPFGYRVFVDSAPVLEKALGRNAGLGWIGKHTNLIHRSHGSLFLLGEIFTDLPLPASPWQSANHCGSCTACIEVCPTQAIIAPYQLDARRCIAYLTIEYRGSIPLELRPLIGNRIFGCDDCQLVCPWNRYAGRAALPDFDVRHGLDAPRLLELFAWSEQEYLHYTEGSPLRRIGYPGWQRNIAIALGNGRPEPAVLAALSDRLAAVDALLAEHIHWALARLSHQPSAAHSSPSC